MAETTVVRLENPSANPASDSEVLWRMVRGASRNLSFGSYAAFINSLILDRKGGLTTAADTSGRGATTASRQVALASIDTYQLLKAATQMWLMQQASVLDLDRFLKADGTSRVADDRLSAAELKDMRDRYLVELDATGAAGPYTTPYMSQIRESLGHVPLKDPDTVKPFSYGIDPRRLTGPIGLELIWSYWMEEAGLVQTMNVISHRFQNRRAPYARDPLAAFATDPLRGLSSLLWGYVSDERNRLSVPHRAHEYISQYGLPLRGLAVPELHPVDVRARFIGAFHDLLSQTLQFYRDVDDRTIDANAFTILTSLRDLQLVLTEGMHNQYGDLTWNARLEMMMMQWILAQPEIREFLQWRAMMPYAEEWMGAVDVMNKVQNWNEASVMNFHELATGGEQLLLSVRFGHWHQGASNQDAANWAIFFRDTISKYIYAYRAVTGVDLSAEPVTVQGTPLRDDARYRVPSDLLRQSPQRTIIGPTTRGALGGVGFTNAAGIAGRLGSGQPEAR